MLSLKHFGVQKRGDYLIVAISTDEFNWNEKEKTCADLYEQRAAIVKAIQYVDEVIPQNHGRKRKQGLPFNNGQCNRLKTILTQEPRKNK